MMQTWGAKVHPSPSNLTGLAQKIFKLDLLSSGSLGIAIFEAVEMTSLYEDTKCCLGSVRDQHNRVVLNIFNVIRGKVMRDFKGSANEFAIGGSGSSPVFICYDYYGSYVLSVLDLFPLNVGILVLL
nr:tryptophan synthase beta chain 2 [Tanacetum cinerariifolium]